MNTFNPGDRVRRKATAANHLGTHAGWEYVVDRLDDSPTAFYPSGDLYVVGNTAAHSTASFELVTPAAATQATTTLGGAPLAPGLYRDVDGRGWLRDVYGGWYSVHDVEGEPVDPTPVDGEGDGWWDVKPGFVFPDPEPVAGLDLDGLGLQVRVQVRRAAQ